MKSKRFPKSLIVLCAVVLCAAAFSITAVALRPQEDPSRRWGELEQEYQNEETSGSDGTPAITGAHFTVSTEELNHVIAVQALIDPDTAEEIAKNLLVEKYSLYYQAQEAGVVVSDAYLDELIEENIEVFSEVMSTNENYVSFLEGLGMTNEECWRSRKDELRITESIEAWKDLKYDEFVQANGYDVDPPADLDMQWEEYLDRLTAEIIARENVRYSE